MTNTDKKPSLHKGSCHCGAVRYEVEVDATAASRCNCTICTKVCQTGALVKPSAFRLTAGADQLTPYVWGGKISTRYFCKTCGIHVYGAGHLPQLGGDFVSVNLNTLDDIDVGTTTVMYFDGRHDNWMAGTRATPWPI
jgi:hypothetical protein